MRNTNTLVVALVLMLLASPAFAFDGGPKFGHGGMDFGNPQPSPSSSRGFEVRGPLGDTQMRGVPDSQGGYTLYGPMGQTNGYIRNDGQMSDPYGRYTGRISDY